MKTSMNQQNRPELVPPSELVQGWAKIQAAEQAVVDHWQHIATRAAQWGADQVLDACRSEMSTWGAVNSFVSALAEKLRAARRPKPQTLNSVALQMLDTIERDQRYLPEITDTIRRALEQLPEAQP